MVGSGVPLAYTGNQVSNNLVRSPTLLNSVQDRVHYLHSILIANTSLSQLSFVLIQHAKVRFFNYDGENFLAARGV